MFSMFDDLHVTIILFRQVIEMKAWQKHRWSSSSHCKMTSSEQRSLIVWFNTLSQVIFLQLVAMAVLTVSYGNVEHIAISAAMEDDKDTPKVRRRRPSPYILNRSLYYKLTVFETYNDTRFKQTVRFPRPKFNILVSLLEGYLKTMTPIQFHNVPNRSMEVKFVVAIALNRLSSGNTSFSVAETFGVSPQIVGRCVKRFCNAVNKVLLPKYLKWPTISERETIKAEFKSIQGFKNCVGAIDCTHVYLKLPGHKNATDYTDRNRQRSTVMQAIVDAKMRFLNVCVGFPCSIHDTRVLANSSFWAKRFTWLNGDCIC